MRILALDAALARGSACVTVDGVVAAQAVAEGGRGQAGLLAPLVRRVLDEAGIPAPALDGVAVSVGPGSFTGLRAALSLGHGIALAAGCPIVGVTVAEALRAAVTRLHPGALAGRALWVGIDSRRGRVFLDREGALAAWDLASLPRPAGPVALAGDGAGEIATRLAARGDDVLLTDARQVLAEDVARVGARRLAGALPPLPAQPLYVDPPEAKLPASGLRPAPS
jgi:tRNA threonylcarbamoyl adenosine modification protein YeaZ